MIILFNFSLLYVSADDNLYIWSKSSILIEAETGKVLAENNADRVMPPASLTKMMTLLLALEAIEDGKASFNDKIVVSVEAAQTGSSSYRLRKNQKVDFRELIESMMVVSSNASAVAIGEHISGNTDDFVLLMNKKAQEIGMSNTHFINPHGLPVYESSTTSLSNMSTSRDLAILARYLLLNFKDETLKITNKKIFNSRFKNYSKRNTNPLLTKVKGVDGLKTGFTGDAGYCLAFTKKIINEDSEDMRIIGITLGAGNDKDRQKSSKTLLDYGKNNFYKKTIIGSGEYIGNTYLYGEKGLPINLVADKSLILVIKNNMADKLIKNKKIVIDSLKAPIKKGQKLGKIIYTLYNDSIVTIDLRSNTQIEKVPLTVLIKIWWKEITE